MEKNTFLSHKRAVMADLMREAFHLKKRPVLKNVSGSQGITLLMNNEIIIKVPLNEKQGRQLETMVALLQLIKPKTKVHTPDLKTESVETSCSDERQTLAFGYYPLLKGRIFPEMSFFYDQDIDYRENVVCQIGAYVADLHSLTSAEVDSLQIPTAVDYLRKVLFRDFAQETNDIPLFKREQFLNNVYEHVFEGCDSKVVCHMDLHMKNMCFDESWEKLTGVFDYGLALKGPKELEMLGIATVYDEEMTAFYHGYRHQRGGEGFNPQSPQFKRVSTYLSPFTRGKHMPALIERMK